MSEKSADTRKGGRAKKGDDGVLGSLPNTRPNRLGRRRDAAAPAVPVKPEAVAEVAQAAKAENPRPKAPGKPKAAAKPKRKEPAVSGPRPVRPATPALGDTAPPQTDRPAGAPQSGTELVATVVQAAGELVQIGFTVGGQILKRAVDRLPKP
ncbi:MAG: hypothetical protein M3P50_07700 [Actinomycetota bacterium]|nr:hypothetical protein [Actinomycetota bacterium]